MKPLLGMLVGVMVAVGAMTASGQGIAALRARELFYTPPPNVAAAAPAAPVAAAATPTPAPKKIAKAAPATKRNQGDSGSKAAVTKAAVPTADVSTKPAAAVPLGMRYSVLKRNATGQYAEVDPDATFSSGDRVRFQVQSNETGYLYVVAQGSSGNWQLLFPSPEVAAGSNMVHRGETRQIPAGDRGQFVFDEQGGTEKLFFVLSRQPEPSLEKLIYSVGGGANSGGTKGTVGDPGPRVLMAQATVGDDVISRIRGEMLARDLIFEKVEGAKVVAASGGDVKVETAAYVVNRSAAPDARLVVDVGLKHK